MQHIKAKHPAKTSLIYNDYSFPPLVYMKTNKKSEVLRKNMQDTSQKQHTMLDGMSTKPTNTPTLASLPKRP